jgi:hypothetical protein
MFVAVSCSKDAEIIIPDPEPVPPIVFAVDVDLSTAPAGNFNTRAVLSEADEYAITVTGDAADFRVLAFDTSNDELLYTRPVKEFTPGTGTMAGSYTFTVSLDITESSKTVDLWFIANAASKWDPLATASIGKTKLEVADLLKYTEADGVTQVQVVDADRSQPIAQGLLKKFPLWGVHNGIQVVKLDEGSKGKIKSGTVDRITGVDLYRQVAKIDVALGSNAKTANHKLSSVILYNRNKSGSLVPEVNGSYTNPTDYAFTAVTLPDSPSPAPNDSLRSVTYLAVNDTIKNSIYAFEIDSVGTPPGADVEAYFYEPCLILGARYQNATDVTWYRVPFLNGNSRLQIIRNKRYNVTIAALNGPGWSTPKEALESANVDNITASVIEWTDIDVPFPD